MATSGFGLLRAVRLQRLLGDRSCSATAAVAIVLVHLAKSNSHAKRTLLFSQHSGKESCFAERKKIAQLWFGYSGQPKVE
jgi:cytolysin (calcineurin-like family phosphatase)